MKSLEVISSMENQINGLVGSLCREGLLRREDRVVICVPRRLVQIYAHYRQDLGRSWFTDDSTPERYTVLFQTSFGPKVEVGSYE